MRIKSAESTAAAPGEQGGTRLALAFRDDRADRLERTAARKEASMQARGIGWSVALALVLGCGSRPTDTVIERRVERQLASEASLRGHPIDVTSIGGEVWLSGYVSSRAHRARAEEIAERVRGVHFVRNLLRLGSPRVSSPGPAEATSPHTSSSNGGEATPDPSVLGRPGQPIVLASP